MNRAFFTNVDQTRRQRKMPVSNTRRFAGPPPPPTPIPSDVPKQFRRFAGSNPAADANGNITINAGQPAAGRSSYQGKVGMTFRVTDKWTIAGVDPSRRAGSSWWVTRPI